MVSDLPWEKFTSCYSIQKEVKKSEKTENQKPFCCYREVRLLSKCLPQTWDTEKFTWRKSRSLAQVEETNEKSLDWNRCVPGGAHLQGQPLQRPHCLQGELKGSGYSSHREPSDFCVLNPPEFCEDSTVNIKDKPFCFQQEDGKRNRFEIHWSIQSLPRSALQRNPLTRS